MSGHRNPSVSEAGPSEDLVRVLREEGIRDRRVLEAFRRVRREQFVPLGHVLNAYEDRPIPIAQGQVTTQPSLVARMVEALRLTGGERVLEVGTGLGFQTAILAALARVVYSIERFSDLAEQARRNLEVARVVGPLVLVGDGTTGLPEHAPFDAIVVAAAAPQVPAPLVAQLAEGGRLVHPLGPGGNEVVTAFRKEGGTLIEEAQLVRAYFVPLVGRHALAGDEAG
jgi:protein-L-isoaspartate(D-aspartate) O-methyltransferase